MSDLYAVPNKLPAKQVSILAQRKKRILHDKSLNEVRHKHKHQVLKKKSSGFKKAEKFIHAFRNTERDSHRMIRSFSRKNLITNTPEEKKLAVVMRHRAKQIASPVVNSALKTLRLVKLHNAVFLKLTKETKILLKVIEPYVIWGYPNINTVREMIFKNGFMKIAGKKTPITSNTEIEQQLGEHGVICIEDIVHELFTVGESFDRVNKFICPFKLRKPQDGFAKKLGVSIERGGEFGNRGDDVNDFIKTCM